MSIEAAIYDILSGAGAVTALVGGSHSPRIYPLGIPAGKSMPAAVYQQISSVDHFSCSGHDNPRTDRVQVTCWAENSDGARTLAEAVRTALAAGAGAHGSVTVLYCSFLDEGDAIDFNEQSERLDRYGKRQDWEIAYTT